MSDTPATPEMASEHGAAAYDQTAGATLEQQLAELQAKHAEVSDAYLRAKAEAESMRRRSEEEIAKARKFAVESFAESLLPIKDSLEAALASPQPSRHPVETVLEGVTATLRQLGSALSATRSSKSTSSHHQVRPHQHQPSAWCRPIKSQHRRGVLQPVPDRRSRAAPCSGHRGCAEVKISKSRLAALKTLSKHHFLGTTGSNSASRSFSRRNK